MHLESILKNRTEANLASFMKQGKKFGTQQDFSQTFRQFKINGLPVFTNKQLVRKLVVSDKLSPMEENNSNKAIIEKMNPETQSAKFKISQILSPSIVEESPIKRGSTLDTLGFTTEKNWSPQKIKMRRTGSLIKFHKSSETVPPLGYYDLQKAQEKLYPKVRMLVTMKKPNFRSISNQLISHRQDQKNEQFDKFLPQNMEGVQMKRKISELQQISHQRYDLMLKAENEIMKQKQRLMPQTQDFDDAYFQQLPQNIDILKKRLKNLKRELNKIGKQKKKKDFYD